MTIRTLYNDKGDLVPLSPIEGDIEFLGVKDLRGLEKYLDQILKENKRDMSENPYREPQQVRKLVVDTPNGVYHFDTIYEVVEFLKKEHPKCTRSMVYRALNGIAIYNESITIQYHDM